MTRDRALRLADEGLKPSVSRFSGYHHSVRLAGQARLSRLSVRCVFRQSTAAALATLSLAACQTTPATPPPPAPVAVCIPLGNVSPAQQKAASAALKAITAEQRAALGPIFIDWQRMRDADRACMAFPSITTESGHPLP